MSDDALPLRNGSDDDQDDSFEASLGRLHEVVTQLEGDELTLEDTIARFQEGSALARRCFQMIDAAELKVSELSPVTASADTE